VILITFGYSQSPNYQHALLTPGLSSTGEGKNVRYMACFDFAGLPQALKLWDLVGNWKTAHFEMDGEELDRAGLGRVRCVYDCWKKGHELPNPEAYCRRPTPRHGHPEDEIQRTLTRCRQLKVLNWGFSWLEHGYVTLSGGWAVDKDWIKGQAENELWRTRVDLCPLFDKESLDRAIAEIPVEFSRDWIFEAAKVTKPEPAPVDNVVQFRPHQ
jgi:hypothetical protein